MRELMTTLLDALGILLVAAGIGAAFWSLIGWPSLALVGLVVMGASWLVSWLEGRHEE